MAGNHGLRAGLRGQASKKAVSGIQVRDGIPGITCGRPLDETKIVYKTLLHEMRVWGLRPTCAAREMGIAYQSFHKKMCGQREWKLRECVVLRRLMGRQMDLEDLFREG